MPYLNLTACAQKRGKITSASLMQLLCRRFVANVPAREDQYRRVALQRLREHLGTLHTEIYPPVLDRRER